MADDSLLAKIDALNVWSRRGERAPHKPLLLLLALGRFSSGQRTLPFSECERPLTELLREFGPGRQSFHPEYPFWRLRNDGLWVVSSTRALPDWPANADPPKSELRAMGAVGSFPDDLQRRLAEDPELLAEMARRLLAAHFPESLHPEILAAVGLTLDRTTTSRRPRDPRFRARVLAAYEYRCAVCGLDLRIGNVTVAVEAAHIRWHQAGGPDEEPNGLALCTLHHKLFDLGGFTVEPERRVVISDAVTGASRFEEVLLRHHGRPIGRTVQPEHAPAPVHLAWHRREVFKGRGRPLDPTPPG